MLLEYLRDDLSLEVGGRVADQRVAGRNVHANHIGVCEVLF